KRMATPINETAVEVPPPFPEWPLLPAGAAEAVRRAVDQALWDPTVLNDIHPLEDGPVPRFERDFGARLGLPYAVALCSGAAALRARRRGRPVGTPGDRGCLSFGPRKHLPCGEGGMLATGRRDLYEKAVAASQHPNRAARLLGLRQDVTPVFWPYRMHPL